eukprot:s279_g20.t1
MHKSAKRLAARVLGDAAARVLSDAAPHESLQAIEAFIWNRERPEPDVAFGHWRQHAPNCPNIAWAEIIADELFQQALRQRGSAPGPDGFTGSEVGFWPLKSWQILEQLLRRRAERGETPRFGAVFGRYTFKNPDATLRSKDSAIAAKDMRPISVQRVIPRIVASAWTRRASTRAWVRSWVHPSACGGLPGKGVAEATDTLLQQFECLRHLGCPPVMLAFLDKIWTQQRWLTYRNEYLPNPVFVSASMPQGDAVSPLTLLAILTGLTPRIFLFGAGGENKGQTVASAVATRYKVLGWGLFAPGFFWLGVDRARTMAVVASRFGPAWISNLLDFTAFRTRSQHEKHQLRESWRRQLFSDFMALDRRDAAAVQDAAASSEQRVTLARKTFQELDTHGRAVMSGAVVSDPRFNVMCHEEIQPCTRCDSGEVPSWDHVAWSCSGSQSSRPPVPNRWPVGHAEIDGAVLAHLASVRSKLLDRRYCGA